MNHSCLSRTYRGKSIEGLGNYKFPGAAYGVRRNAYIVKRVACSVKHPASALTCK
jgi:hypothetical protein